MKVQKVGLKQILRSIMAMTLLMAMLLSAALPAAAVRADTSGDWSYLVSGGNAMVMGYTGTGGDVVIPDTLGGYPVTRIGDNVFKNLSLLTGVTIPDSVTLIGNYAFQDCTGLASAIIGSSVIVIGKNAFSGCSSLTNVIIPDDVTNIDDGAFSGCSGLTSVSIGSSVTNISVAAFLGCSGLTSVIIPGSVTNIGTWAFMSCSSLAEAIFLGNSPNVGIGVFDGCADTFRVHYDCRTIGWTTPTWHGYRAECPMFKVNNAITGFNIPGQAGPTAINSGARKITLRMPYGTDVRALVPAITIIGDSVNPASGDAHDFTNPVTYSVSTTDPPSHLDYTVTVKVALNPAKAITGFNIPGQVGPTAISQSAHTITLTMLYGTDVRALVPIITITGAWVNPASGAVNDFTNPVTYTVMAADVSTQDYTVTVIVALPPILLNPLVGTGASTSHGSSVAGTTTMTQPTSLPNIQVQSASLSASKVAPGTPVTVTANIANKGTVNGTKKVTLYVNGQVESTQGITVNSGASSQLSFNVSCSEPGVYSVYVDGISAGSFTVSDSSTILYVSIACLFVAFVLGAILIIRKPAR